jgi:enoyl-CoA hydratase
VPADELLTRAKALTQHLASVPAELVRQTKMSMLALRGCVRQDDAVAFEFRQQFQSLQTENAKANITKLLAKIQKK